MEYNTTRTPMQMPEYGRIIQSMAEQLLTTEDRALRLKNAEAIIDVMAILNPGLKQIEDYRHKLWDHLHQMTGFRLDVDGPYPPPSEEEVRRKPEVLPYPKARIRHRHLGGNMEQVLEKALEEKDEEKRQGFAQHLGYYMKLAYATWHKEPIHEDAIRAELANLSGNTLQYEPSGYKVHVDMRPEPTFGGKKKRGRGYVQQQQPGQNSGTGGSMGGGGGGMVAGNNYNKKRRYKKNKGGGGAQQS